MQDHKILQINSTERLNEHVYQSGEENMREEGALEKMTGLLLSALSETFDRPYASKGI